MVARRGTDEAMARARYAIVLALAFTLAAASLVAGCGGGGGDSEEDKVKATLERFAEDVRKGDEDAFCKGVTPRTEQILEKISKGIDGRRASCERIVGRQMDKRPTAAITDEALKAIEAAEVELSGDKAKVGGRGEKERLPLERVDGDWRVDVANSPWDGYGLQTTAACTENVLRGLRRPLPRPTRRGIAAEARRSAADYARLIRTIQRLNPPPREAQAHKDLLRLLRGNRDSWSKASKRLAGLGAPLKSFNQALKAAKKRAEQIEELTNDLEFGCSGNALTLRNAEDYRVTAHATCRTALRRFKALAEPKTPAEAQTFATRFKRVGNRMASKLRRLKPPDPLRRLHRASVAAFADTIGDFDKLVDAGGSDQAVERFELSALRYAVGFFRLGLPQCGEV